MGPPRLSLAYRTEEDAGWVLYGLGRVEFSEVTPEELRHADLPALDVQGADPDRQP